MGQQVSITELKEQIEAAKRSLAEMSPVDIAADPLFQPAAMPAANLLVWLVGMKMTRQTLSTKIWWLMMIWLRLIWRPVKCGEW